MSPTPLLIVAASALGVLALVAVAKFVIWLVTRD
jgi:hypothetical protein